MQREGRGGERRLHDRLAYVVRVDNRTSVEHVAGSACRSRRCVGLCIDVAAVLAAAADAVLSSQCLPLPLMPCKSHTRPTLRQ